MNNSTPKAGGSYVNKDGKLERVEGTEPAPLPQRKKTAPSADAQLETRKPRTTKES